MSRDPESGYAMLAALLIVALVAVITATCLAAVNASRSVTVSDAGIASASAAAAEALSDACEHLRWHPSERSGALGESVGSTTREARWTPAAPGATGGPRVDVAVTAASGAAQNRLRVEVELQQECVQGVTVGGNAVLSAPAAVSGSGVYVGGSLLGREWLTFVASEGGGPPADGVRGEVWPLAAVHTVGSIWQGDVEIHSADTDPGASWPADTDTHSGAEAVAAARRCVQPPERPFVVAFAERAQAGSATVDLSRLPAHHPDDGRGVTCQGMLVLVRPDEGTPVTLVGERSASACPLTLLVDGDAAVGSPGAPLTVSSGAVVVLGTLTVRAPWEHSGHIYAGHLSVAALVRIDVVSDWRAQPVAGLTRPVVVALEEP